MPLDIIKQHADTPFLQYCPSCKRKHYMLHQSCPTCRVYETPQPVSDAVYDACHADYSCDGCEAYKEHQA